MWETEEAPWDEKVQQTPYSIVRRTGHAPEMHAISRPVARNLTPTIQSW